MWDMIKNIPKVDIGADPETKKKEAREAKAEAKKQAAKNGKTVKKVEELKV